MPAASPSISSIALALALVSSLARERATATVAVDVPGVNESAIAWAEAAGWKPSFETARMYNGQAPEIDRSGLFAITILELG